MTEVWYRYEDGDACIFLSEYEVLKHTPKGVWIKHWQNDRGKFIRLDTTKQWASPTIEAARTAYIARKQKQISILAAQHDRAVEMLHQAKTGTQWSDIAYPIKVDTLQPF